MLKKFLILIIASTLYACHPADNAIHSLEKLTYRIENKSSQWSAMDWDDAALYFGEIVGTIQRYDYSDEEWQYIYQLEDRCLTGFSQRK